MKKLPIGIQSFEVLRGQGYLYVDKTEWVYRLVDEGMFYFLARPRRFGKSLLVSTLKCLFQGRRELFEGLWIAEHSDWEWQEHPVVVIDFNEIAVETPEALESSLFSHLDEIAVANGLSLSAKYLGLRLRELILALARKSGKPVVVLVDEYDKPLISHLGRGDEELRVAIANRDILKSFFGVLKGASVSSVLRFVFFTGVSQFSKVSIFSELNNLFNISMVRQYADMLGYTQGEVEDYFAEHIERWSEELGVSAAEVVEELARQYDGYRFSEREVRVYNPFSVLSALSEGRFGNYWFETGTPTFLVNLLRQENYPLLEIDGVRVDQSLFTVFDVEELIPEALLFQTGYLTIKDVDGEIYTLGYPNREVKTSFSKSLLFTTEGVDGRRVSSHVLQLARHLGRGDLEAFFETMRAIYGSIPYDIGGKRDEAYFHTIFYLAMAASGGEARSSVLTSRGRIDLVVAFPDKVYVMEFKCDQGAEVGLRQIRERGYAERYARSGKRVVLVGINFSTEERNIAEWKAEVLG